MAVRPISPSHVLETLGQHADDAIELAGEADRLANNAGITAEAPAPQPMAQNHCGVIAGNLVVGFELTAKHRRGAEQCEEPGRHLHAAQLLGLLAVANLQVGAEIGGEPREGLQFLAVVTKVRG